MASTLAQRRPEAYLRRPLVAARASGCLAARSTKAGGVPPATPSPGGSSRMASSTLNEGRRRTSGDPRLWSADQYRPRRPLNEGRRRTSGDPLLIVVVFDRRLIALNEGRRRTSGDPGRVRGARPHRLTTLNEGRRRTSGDPCAAQFHVSARCSRAQRRPEAYLRRPGRWWRRCSWCVS